jgi:hypothetical protein
MKVYNNHIIVADACARMFGARLATDWLLYTLGTSTRETVGACSRHVCALRGNGVGGRGLLADRQTPSSCKRMW